MASNDDIIRCTAKMQEPATGAIQNVWHFRFNNIVPIADGLVALDVASIVDDIYNDLEGIILHTVEPVEMELFNVTTGSPMGVVPFDTFTAGAASGEGLPPACSALLTLTTGVAKVLGKKYIGILAESGQDTGEIGSGIITALTTLGTLLIGSISVGATAIYTPGVIDQHGTFRPFNGFRVANRIAYQRRRKLGRGI